jgi:hypothetical protein
MSDDAHWLTSLLRPFACSFVLYITSPRTPSLDSSREYTLFYCIFYVEDLTKHPFFGVFFNSKQLFEQPI